MDTRLHITRHVARSDRRSKMMHMFSLNTDTYTNAFCQEMSKDERLVCHRCYAMRLARFYGRKSMRPFERNGEILSSRPLRRDEIPVLNHVLFRFHSYGELINVTHYVNLCNIAIRNPDTTFALWTKRLDLVDVSVKPANMILVYSNPFLGQHVSKPPGFDRVFTVFPAGADVGFNCGEYCWSCRKYYRHDGPELIIERLR